MSVDNSKMKKSLKESGSSLQKFGKGLFSVKGAVAAFGAALGAGVVINSLKNLTTEAFSSLDALGKFSDSVGASVSDMQGLKLAANGAGVEFEVVKKGLQLLNIASGNLQNGLGGTGDALRSVGITAEQAANMNSVDLLKSVSDIYAKQGDSASKAAIAVKLFGEEGLQMATFLDQGADGIQNVLDESDKMGDGLTRIEVSQIELANTAFGKMHSALERIGQRIAIQIAPIAIALGNALTEAATHGFKMGEIVGNAMEWIVSAIGVGLDIVHTLKLGFNFIQVAWTAQIAIIVKGLGYLAQGIQEIVNLIPGVETTFGDTFSDIGDSLLELTGEQWDGAMNALIEEPPSTGFKTFFQKMKDESRKAAEQLQEDAKSNGDVMNAGLLQATDNANKLIEKLQEQISVFGMSSDEAEIFKLRQMGVSEAVLEQAESYSKQLASLEESRKAQEEFANQGKSIFEATRTPLEKYEAEIEKLTQLLNTGDISLDTFKRAEQQAKEGLGKDKNSFQGFAGAAKAGSAEARTAVLNNRFRSNDPMKKIEDNTKITADESKKQTRYLENIYAGGGSPEMATFNIG